MTSTPFARFPSLTSSLIALGAGILAVGLIADTTLQRQILAASAAGSVLFAVGVRRYRSDGGGLGVGLAVCGCVPFVLAVGYGSVVPPQLVHRLEVLPGIVGIWLLAAALAPLRFRRSRLLVDVGAGLVFVSVLTSGVVQGASATALVVAAAATILAWDAAENAVSVGGQVGAASATARAELVHGAASAAVAGAVIVVVLGLARLGIEGLPFAALVALLVAVIAIVLSYHA